MDGEKRAFVEPTVTEEASLTEVTLVTLPDLEPPELEVPEVPDLGL